MWRGFWRFLAFVNTANLASMFANDELEVWYQPAAALTGLAMGSVFGWWSAGTTKDTE